MRKNKPDPLVFLWPVATLIACGLSAALSEMLLPASNLGPLGGGISWLAALGVWVGLSGARRKIGFAIWLVGFWLVVLALALGAGAAMPWLAPLPAAAFLVYVGGRGEGRARRVAALLLTLTAVWVSAEVGLDIADPAWRPDDGQLTERQRTWQLGEHTNLFGDYDDPDLPEIMLPGGPMPLTKTPDVYRVLCLGSSSTYGMGLEIDQAYPARLAEVLGPGYEVGNVGWSGYNSFQLAIYLKQVLLKLKPDLVIFYYGGNEQYGADAVAYWRWANDLLKETELSNPEARRQAVMLGTADPTAVRLLGWLYKQRSYHWLRKRIVGARQTLQWTIQPQDEIDPEKILNEMIDALAANGVKLLLSPEVNMQGQAIAPEYAALMRQTATEHEHVFYTEIFAALDDPACFLDVVHVSPQGAEQLAAALAPVVRKIRTGEPIVSQSDI